MKVQWNQATISLPDVFIPGAAKSGTTSLYQMLSQHPEVYFPDSEKEPFFFCFGNKRPDELEQKIIDRVTYDEKAYFDLFSGAKEGQLLFDGSTAYLYKYKEAIEQMKRYYGERIKDVKIVILLRNPVGRAWSHYNFLIRNGFETLPFSQAIQPEVMKKRSQSRWGFDYLGFGLYADQVKAYQEVFPHTKVYLLEDLKNPSELFEGLFEFLEIEPIEIEKAAQANPSGVPKSKMLVNAMRKNKILKKAVNLLPEKAKHKVLAGRDKAMTALMKKETMDDETRTSLISFYKDDLARLEKLINRDLSAWKE